MGCDWAMQVKIQAPVAMVMQLIAAVYLIGGELSGDVCASFGSSSSASSSSSTYTSCSSGVDNSCGMCDGICDDGGPGSEYNLCALGTDTSDCGSRTGRRLEQDFHDPVLSHRRSLHTVVDSLLAKANKTNGPQRRRLVSVCVDADRFGDVKMHEITFGSDNVDGSGAALVAFLLAVLGVLLCLVATVFACKGKFKQVMGLLGVALICNVLYYIYMIPYDATGQIEVKPGYSWGASCNNGAMINLAIGLLSASKAAALKVSPAVA
jgi:hypothetical protein